MTFLARTVRTAVPLRRDSHPALTLLSYVRNIQINTLPFYGQGASSILSAAVNVFEVQSLCSLGELPSPFLGACLPLATMLTRTSDSHQIPSCSSTISLRWRSTHPGFSWHTHGK